MSDIQNLADPNQYNTSDDEGEQESISRNFNDVIKGYEEYLTKEERLLISLHKNSAHKRNDIYRVFIKKYHKREVSSSAIATKKKRLFAVLAAVGELVRYKQAYSIDVLLSDLLTNRQFAALRLYEQRKTTEEMAAKLNVKSDAVTRLVTRTLTRVSKAKHDSVKNYIVLLTKVLKFSRKLAIPFK